MQIDTENMVSRNVVDRILKESHVRMQCKIPIESLQHHEVVDRIYPAMEEMLITLQASVYQEDFGPLIETLAIQTPKTWFDHFKQDHFPKWLLDRYPVEYVTETRSIDMAFSARYPTFQPAKRMPYVIVREVKVDHVRF